MPSGHSSSSHSSSSSGSSSGGSHSGSSGGFSGGGSSGGGGHSHDNDNNGYDHHSIFPFPIQGLLWFIGIAALFVVILLKVNIKDELNKHSNSDSYAIYEAAHNTVDSGAASTSANTAQTAQGSSRSFKKYSPGYGIEHDHIYVPEIGRNCIYDANSGNYYDIVTDCYFWLNNDVTPPVWQYWYEDISSDYGDYGWMEYDYSKDAWFIETEKGKWEELPSYYNTDKLWHMDKPTQGRYNGQDSVYVPALGRDCPYREYISCYVDEETRTYFYYNTYLRPAQWLYWYDDYGWLMYDSQNAKWYHLDEYWNGIKWTEMPGDWKDPDVWHFEST